MTKPKSQNRPGNQPAKQTQRAIAKKLGITPGRLTQLKSLGCPVDSHESAKDWIETRANDIGKGAKAPSNLNDARMKKISLECQLLMIEINKKSTPDAGSIPIEEIKTALWLFLRYCQNYARRAAETHAVNLVGADAGTLIKEFERFADTAHYTGVGATIATASPELSRIFEGILSDGDERYLRGDGLAEACRNQAKHEARQILADELKADPLSRSAIIAEVAKVGTVMESVFADFSRRGPECRQIADNLREAIRIGLQGITKEKKS